jgi:hypothetical protein
MPTVPSCSAFSHVMSASFWPPSPSGAESTSGVRAEAAERYPGEPDLRTREVRNLPDSPDELPANGLVGLLAYIAFKLPG